jgi:replication factor A2
MLTGFDSYADGGGFGFGGDNPMGGGMEMGGGFDGQGEAKSEEKKFREKNILPVSVKQVMDCEMTPEGLPSIDGTVPELVKIFGIVQNYDNTTTTKTQFNLSDGTKTIEAYKWKQQGEGSMDVESMAAANDIKDNTMVCAVGNVKVFQEKRSLFIMSVRPVTQYNELTHHLLSIMLHHAKATKGPIPGSAAAKAAEKAGAVGNYGMGMGAAGGQQSFGTPGGANAFGGAAVKQEVGGVHDDIALAISNVGGSDEGATLESVLDWLKMNGKGHVTEKTIQSFVTGGLEDGTLYGTIDDDHFKLTSES